MGPFLSGCNLQVTFITLASTGCKGGWEIQSSWVSINPAETWGFQSLKEKWPVGYMFILCLVPHSQREPDYSLSQDVLCDSLRTSLCESPDPHPNIKPVLALSEAQPLLLFFADEELHSLLHTYHTQSHTQRFLEGALSLCWVIK